MNGKVFTVLISISFKELDESDFFTFTSLLLCTCNSSVDNDEEVDPAGCSGSEVLSMLSLDEPDACEDKSESWIQAISVNIQEFMYWFYKDC